MKRTPKGTPILSKEEAAAAIKAKEATAAPGEGFTPSSGSVRHEEQVRKKAALEDEIDQIAETYSMYAIDPQKLMNSPALRKLRGKDEFDFEGKMPGYSYGWITIHGNAIAQAKRLGYQFVMDNDPEAKDMAERYDRASDVASGARKWGTQVLMRIRKDVRRDNILIPDALKRAQQQRNTDGNLVETAAKLGFNALPLSGKDQERLMNLAAARQIAMQKFGHQLKEGSVGH